MSMDLEGTTENIVEDEQNALNEANEGKTMADREGENEIAAAQDAKERVLGVTVLDTQSGAALEQGKTKVKEIGKKNQEQVEAVYQAIESQNDAIGQEAKYIGGVAISNAQTLENAREDYVDGFKEAIEANEKIKEGTDRNAETADRQKQQTETSRKDFSQRALETRNGF